MAVNLGELLARVGLDVAGLQADATKAGGVFDRMVNDVGPKMTSLGTTIGLISASLIAAGGYAGNLATKFQNARFAFESMLGSQEAANKHLADLKQFALETPFDFPDLVTASQRMHAMGIETTKVIPYLRTIGDSTAALGMGKDGIDRITLAIGQMSAKGKVSAEEMKQLTEAGLPAWDILAKAIGTDVAGAMDLVQKRMVDSKPAIEALMSGLDQVFGDNMKRQSETFAGRWQQITEKIDFAAAQVGTALLPILGQLLTEHVEPLIASFSDWIVKFAELDPAWQELIVGVGLALPALAAVLTTGGLLISAIGSIAAALPALGTIFGGLLTAINPVTLTIGAVSAALVYAYQTSEPFRQSVDDLWTSVTDFASALTSFAGNLWDTVNAVAPVNEALGWLWEKISGVVAVVGSLAASLIALPFKVFAANLEAANRAMGDARKEIEDMGKAMEDTLAKSNKSIKDHAKSQADAAMAAMGLVDAQGNYITSAKGAKDATDKAKTAIVSQASAAKKLKEKYTEIETAAKRLSPKVEALFSAMTDGTKEIEAQRKALVEHYKEFVHSDKGYRDLADSAEKLNAKVIELSASKRKLADIEIPGVVQALMTVPTPVDEVADALTQMGISGTENFTKIREEAESAYRIIMASDRVSQMEKAAALIKYFEAVQAESKATGAQIPADLQEAMVQAKARIDGPSGLPAQKGAWQNFAAEVSTIVTNMAQDLSKTLWDGDTSWGEKFKGMLKGIGQAFTSAMIQPMINAIVGPEGLIAKGFSKLFDTLFDLDGLLGKIFGGGAGAISNITTGAAGSTAGNVAGSAAGSVSGAVGSIVGGGLMGTIGAIGSVASAVSSIVGNFQMAGMNKSLDLIETAVRRLDIATTQNGDWNILLNTGAAREYLSYVVDDLRHGHDSLRPTLSRVESILGYVLGQIEAPGMLNHTLFMIRDAMATANQSLLHLVDVATDIGRNTAERMGGVFNITVNVSGTNLNPSDVANAVMNQIQAQNRMAY